MRNLSSRGVLKSLLYSLIAALTMYFIFPFLLVFRDGFFDIPIDNKKVVTVIGDGKVEVLLEADCNRFFARELSFTVDPPIRVDTMKEWRNVVRGSATLVIEEDGSVSSSKLDLFETGVAGFPNIHKIRLVSIPARGFCIKQRISVKISNLSFDPLKHSLTLFVRRESSI